MLHDVDKDHDHRSAPAPNKNDQVLNRMAHNTMSTTYKREGVRPQRLIFKNGLIVTYDTDGRASSVYGYVPSISNIPIFVIAKTGYDVFVDVLGITEPQV